MSPPFVGIHKLVDFVAESRPYIKTVKNPAVGTQALIESEGSKALLVVKVRSLSQAVKGFGIIPAAAVVLDPPGELGCKVIQVVKDIYLVFSACRIRRC